MTRSSASSTGSFDVGLPYAEVIGEPIAQSKSPAIHKSWLSTLGLQGDFRATCVPPGELGRYFETRRNDPDWRGCNVTIPHKQSVIAHLDRIDGNAAQIGAVNCISVGRDGLTGWNSDIDGVAAALGKTPIQGEKIVMIGAGGAARAALRYLLEQRAELISILARDPEKAAHFIIAGPPTRVEVRGLGECGASIANAAIVINATSMGMDGAAEMPPFLLKSVADHVRGQTVFDMVYKPLETPFLAAARANGGKPIDGLTMLIGQARAAFRHFFGTAPPADERALRDLLVT